MGRQRGDGHGTTSKRPPLTHFLCLPLVNQDSRPKLEQALHTFKKDVCLDTGNSSGALPSAEHHRAIIHPKAIRLAGTLHFTLGVMSLKGQQLSKAINHLEKLELSSLIDPADTQATASPTNTSLTISLQGLESMHDPEKTSILYVAPSDTTDRLHPFCVALRKTFQDQGFLVEDDRELKLHATIVNTIYAKRRRRPTPKPVKIMSNGQVVFEASEDRSENPPTGHGPDAHAPLKFDARKILEHYSNHLWADSVRLDRIAICEMGAKKITNSEGEVTDERYTEIASVAIPA